MVSTYSREDDCMHDIYTDILLDVYARELLRLIFEYIDPTQPMLWGRGLIHVDCQGCHHMSPSQSDHDLCMLNFDQQIMLCVQSAFRILNENDITHNFTEAVSRSYMLDSVTSNSPRSHLLNPTWRKFCWLQECKVETKLIRRMISLKLFS